MKKTFCLFAFFVLTAVLALACGQTTVEWPTDQPDHSGGLCPDWYPGSENEDGGPGPDSDEDIYGIEVDKIFPCIVWNSAKIWKDDESVDGFIDIGYEYLQSFHGLSGKKAIVIPVGAGS